MTRAPYRVYKKHVQLTNPPFEVTVESEYDEAASHPLPKRVRVSMKADGKLDRESDVTLTSVPTVALHPVPSVVRVSASPTVTECVPPRACWLRYST